MSFWLSFDFLSELISTNVHGHFELFLLIPARNHAWIGSSASAHFFGRSAYLTLVPLYSTRLKSAPIARRSSASDKKASVLSAFLYSNRRPTCTGGARKSSNASR